MAFRSVLGQSQHSYVTRYRFSVASCVRPQSSPQWREFGAGYRARIACIPAAGTGSGRGSISGCTPAPRWRCLSLPGHGFARGRGWLAVLTPSCRYLLHMQHVISTFIIYVSISYIVDDRSSKASCQDGDRTAWPSEYIPATSRVFCRETSCTLGRLAPVRAV